MAIGQALLNRPQARQGSAQKPKPAQDQPIKQEQSLELIEMLLGASIGCLSFLRGLLPEDSFVDRSTSPTLTSYRSFTQEVDGPSNKASNSSGLRLKRVRRGHSDEADRLLDWLEHGVFEALSKSFLKAFQVAVYLDPKQPGVVIESYTFSFAYNKNDDGTPSPPLSLHVKDNKGREVTLTDARKNFQQITRRLIMITQNLPPLPDERYLTMRLYYTDWTPPAYSPPFFRRLRSSDARLRFNPESEYETIERSECGTMSTGHHAVSLKVSAIQDSEPTQHESKRVRSRITEPEDDIMVPPLQIISPPLPRVKESQEELPKKELFIKTMSSFSNSQASAQSSQGEFSSEMFRNTSSSARKILPARRNTKSLSLRELQERAKLHEMLQPSSLVGDLIETQLDQGSSQISPNITNNVGNRPECQNPLAKTLVETGLVESQDIQNQPVDSTETSSSVPTKALLNTKNTPCMEDMVARLKLSASKILELEGLKTAKGQNQEKKAMEEGDEVTCECGDIVEEYGMIACDVCNGWLHAHCYGYHSVKDSRIPEYNACYTCLLGKELRLLEEMKTLTLFRRALKKVWDEGYPATNKIFATWLGCDLPTALDITKRLEAEEFIVNTAKTRSGRSKRKATVPIRYRAVKDEKNRLNMEKQYFDPLAKISHHFDNLETALEIQNPESIALDSLGKAYVRSTSPIIGDSISVIPRSLVLNNNSRVSSVKNYKESSSRTKLKSYQAIQKELTQLCIPESQEGPAELAKSGAAEVEDKDQMDLDLDLDEVVMESQKGNTIEKNADCSKPSSQADDASPVDPRDRSVWFAHVGIVVENLFVPAIP